MKLRNLAAGLLVTSALTPAWAHAQTTPSPAPAQRAASTDIGEVVVTAQRREERLFEVPISITAITADTIQQAGVVNGRDLTTITPGLNAATQGFAFQPSIRGVTSTSTTIGDETNVALYVDNVYSPFQAGNSFNLGAIERIEVLKGPQGTLFGRNATGGAIRVFTEAPSFTPKMKFSADYGFDIESREVNAYGSGPITDTLAGSLNIYGYKDNGYVDNLTPGEGNVADTNQFTARGKLLWRPTDSIDVTLGLYTSNYNSSASFATGIYQGVLSGKNTPGVIVADTRLFPYKVALNFNPYVKTTSSGGFLRAEWHGDGLNLASTTSYTRYALNALLDSDRTNLNVGRFPVQGRNIVVTQEFEASSDTENKLNYSAGLFLYQNKARNPGATHAEVDSSSWAAFGELYFDVTEQLRLIGGYRYTAEEKDAFASNALTRYSQGDDWTSSTYRATVQYKFNAENNVYFSYNTGFKSGVISPGVSAALTQTVEPEEITAYEIGARSRLGPLTIQAAAFRYEYDNIQVQINNITGNSGPTTLIENAATAEIEGAELQVGGRFGEHLTGELGVSWLPTAEYTAYNGTVFVPNAGGNGATAVKRDLSGTRVIRSPELTYNLTLSYTTALAGGEFRASGTYFYSDDFFFVAGGAVSQDNYNTLNARVSWTTPDDRATFSLWARNVTDEFYYLQMGANTTGYSGSYAQPRVVGVGVSLKY
jgi:iron complex outermembrane receptor protein